MSLRLPVVERPTHWAVRRTAERPAAVFVEFAEELHVVETQGLDHGLNDARARFSAWKIAATKMPIHKGPSSPSVFATIPRYADASPTAAMRRYEGCSHCADQVERAHEQAKCSARGHEEHEARNDGERRDRHRPARKPVGDDPSERKDTAQREQ